MPAEPRIVVLGGAGQLGRAILRCGGTAVIALDRAAADVTDRHAVADALVRTRPDAVVNAAAFTAVDRAETEPHACFAVNRDGAGHVAAACAAAGVPLVHLSTDYVFNGRKGTPYLEADPVDPPAVHALHAQDHLPVAGDLGVAVVDGRHPAEPVQQHVQPAPRVDMQAPAQPRQDPRLELLARDRPAVAAFLLGPGSCGRSSRSAPSPRW